MFDLSAIINLPFIKKENFKFFVFSTLYTRQPEQHGPWGVKSLSNLDFNADKSTRENVPSEVYSL